MMKKEYYGLAAGGKAYFLLENLPAQGVLVAVVPDEDASVWHDNLTALAQFFSGAPVHLFSASDHFARLNVLKNLLDDPRGIVIATEGSLEERTMAPGDFKGDILKFRPGTDYDFNRLQERLVALGYGRIEFVEEKGQYSRRGEVLDIWSPDQPLPWRLVFDVNTLESLRTFDVGNQRSEEFLTEGLLLPAREPDKVYLSEYLPSGSLFYFDAPPPDTLPAPFHSYDWLIHNPLAQEKPSVNADFKPFSRWAGNYGLFIEELKRFAGQGVRTVVFCSSQGEKERFEEILAQQRWHGPGPEIFIGPLAEGFYSLSRKLAVFSCQEILYKRRPVSFPKFKTGRRLEGLWEISAGDFVVHEKYGIGKYLGLRKISHGEQESEYLCIEYKGGDKIYIPPDDFRVVQKYVGMEGHRPRLFALDTAAWERVKQRAKEGAQKFAGELLRLYAERQKLPGHAFPADIPWERELADSFPFNETEDQHRAIEEVKADLEAARPMERLICGDVGFGKTEVAVRAAFKVAVSAKQVAVLVPTTVLAEQHFNTFSNRMAPFPVKLALLSRFQTHREQRKIIGDVQSGGVDVVVGTHRLLQKDIAFKDLGLLIIDEEHRFGVKQKEKIKAMKKNVDVLSLSATPIPRTLSLALSSLRDLSVIESPPYGRLPIETHLGPYDEKTVKKIIHAELSRGGQAFYVYNRVETILSRAQYLQSLLPDIRLGIIHGQLPAAQIEKTMWRFLHREIDVLIASTIIESGLDIPTVNTMIIEEAENFGLAQLYQLRGRIGREKQKAYCYLFYTASSLTEDAKKRLAALQEFGELGSGFRLALRDLEIRGAGNILGGEQHGFVREIGFELFSRLIEEASRKLKGIGAQPEEDEKTTVDFTMPAFLPPEYIEAEDLRIIFYRRLAGLKAPEDLEKIREELLDRFGALPEAAENLLTVSEIRLLTRRAGFKGVSETEHGFEFSAGPRAAELSPAAVVALAKDYAGVLEFLRGEQSGIRLLKEGIPGNHAAYLKKFLFDLEKYRRIK